MIYLVRHADAGVRTNRLDDHLRRLSAAGRRDARTLAGRLVITAGGEIISSPYLRCVDTVEPLGQRRGARVQTSDVLTEGAAIEPVLALLREVPDHSVLCTHGAVMEAVMGELDAVGALPIDSGCCDKGVVWVLVREADDLSIVEVIHPSHVGTLVTESSRGSDLVIRSSEQVR